MGARPAPGFAIFAGVFEGVLGKHGAQTRSANGGLAVDCAVLAVSYWRDQSIQNHANNSNYIFERRRAGAATCKQCKK
jgi:hypothetical protein